MPSDVARADLVDFLAVVGVHPQDTAHALALALGGVIDIAAGGQCAGIDAEERQLAHEGVGHDLEGQGGEGLVVGRLTRSSSSLPCRGSVPLTARDVQRRRQIVHDRVQQGLHALVAVGGAAQHGSHLAGDGGACGWPSSDLVDGELFLRRRYFSISSSSASADGFDQRRRDTPRPSSFISAGISALVHHVAQLIAYRSRPSC